MSAGAAIDRETFGLFLYTKRFMRGLNLDQAATEAGVSVPMLVAAEAKRPVSRSTFELLCKWQGEDPRTFEISEGA